MRLRMPHRSFPHAAGIGQYHFCESIAYVDVRGVRRPIRPPEFSCDGDALFVARQQASSRAIGERMNSDLRNFARNKVRAVAALRIEAAHVVGNAKLRAGRGCRLLASVLARELLFSLRMSRGRALGTAAYRGNQKLRWRRANENDSEIKSLGNGVRCRLLPNQSAGELLNELRRSAGQPLGTVDHHRRRNFSALTASANTQATRSLEAVAILGLLARRFICELPAALRITVEGVSISAAYRAVADLAARAEKAVVPEASKPRRWVESRSLSTILTCEMFREPRSSTAPGLGIGNHLRKQNSGVLAAGESLSQIANLRGGANPRSLTRNVTREFLRSLRMQKQRDPGATRLSSTGELKCTRWEGKRA